jgi:hypothetical protein
LTNSSGLPLWGRYVLLFLAVDSTLFVSVKSLA